MEDIDTLVDKLRMLRQKKSTTYKKHTVIYKHYLNSDAEFCREYIPRLPESSEEIQEMQSFYMEMVQQIDSLSKKVSERKNKKVSKKVKKCIQNWYIRNNKPIPDKWT